MSKKTEKSKKRVQFHRKSGVFELRPGKMLYAFCVNAGGHLEHLYWGEDIGESESLSYLQSSNVKIAFQTEAPPIDPSRKKEFVQQFIEREKNKDIKAQQIWKSFRGSNDVYRKRTENLAWRIWTRSKTKGGYDTTKGNAMEMLISSPTMKFRSVGEIDQKHLAPSLKADMDQQRYTVGDNLDAYRKRGSDGETSGRQSPTLDFNKRNFSVSNLQDLLEVDAGQNQHVNSFLISEVYRRKKSIFGKGAIKHEYSDYGTGDFRSPSFRLSYSSDGSHISPMQYKCHRIVAGKLPMRDKCMPHIRSWATSKEGEANFATTLIVTMIDRHTLFEIDLIYTIIHGYDVLVRSTIFRNSSLKAHYNKPTANDGKPQPMISRLHRVMSSTVDFENERGGYFCKYLSGSWARERHVQETQLQPGTYKYLLSFICVQFK